MPDDLMLQRWLSRRDGWMDVLPFDASESERVQDCAAALAGNGGGVAWRILRVHPPRTVLATYDGKRWHPVADDLPAPGPASAPMPWWQPAARLLRRADDQAFVDTVPVERI